MPLRDHFRPPVWTKASWEGFHGGWPMTMVQELAKVLPDNYTSEPRVHLGTHFEIDVCASLADPYEYEVLTAFTPKSHATYAVTIRGRDVNGRSQLETWAYPLVIGQTLPILPIWLMEDLAVSFDLEASYEETCRVLRIDV